MTMLLRILLIGILITFLFQSLPVFSGQTTTDLSNEKALMIIATDLDESIAQSISNTEPNINSTIIKLTTINNFTTFLTSQNLSEYLTIFFILSNTTSTISPDLIKTFTEFINNNGTLVFISSNIWQLDQNILNFLGILSPSNSSHEYVPSIQQPFQFEITNISFNYSPYSYQLGEKISVSSRVGIIEPINASIYQLAKSNDLDNRQFSETYSGIYQTYGFSNTGFALMIPISLVNITDLETLQLIQTLGHYAIHYSLKMSNTDKNSSTIINDHNSLSNDSLIFLNNIDFSIVGEFILGGTLVVGGLLITGVVAIKTIPSLRIKKISDNEEKDSFSFQEPWLVGLITIFISIIGAILYSPNYKRISIFQVLDNPVRKQIIKILEESGFEHFNSLQRKLSIGVSILIWHLKILEEFNIIKNKKVGQYKVVYLVDIPPQNDQVIIYMTIKSKKALIIVGFFIQSPAWKIIELSDAAKFSIELIKYYCTKLYELGVLYFNAESKQYILVHEKKDLVVWLFNRYNKEM